MTIREPSPADLPALREIERAAGEPFRALGMARIADDEPPSVGRLTDYLRAGRLLVAYEGADAAIPVEGLPAICCGTRSTAAPMSSRCRSTRSTPVAASAAPSSSVRSGTADWAPLTLTTFAEVPWNAPYYRRLGFRVLDDAALTPGLRAIRAHEAALGLDAWPRVCMRRQAEHADGPQ